ncbi:hypothetical protein ACTHQY_15100 [Rhodococcoides corynebacterioides]|uniref:hypothetical protein n=1 Tax=Rhodococcoides corynebacterioides TaxID=53972 RepID=UPI003F7E7C25
MTDNRIVLPPDGPVIPVEQTCELPQGAVGTPRCTKRAEHVADIHGCILDQPEHAWVRVRICHDHVVTAHTAFTDMQHRSPGGRAECAECEKPFHRFRDLLLKVEVRR